MDDPNDKPGASQFPQRVDSILRWMHAFEEQWRAGVRPKIEDYLEQVADKERGELLEELLAVEVQLRRDAGETVLASQYETRFAAHSDRIQRAFELADDHSQRSGEEAALETRSIVGPAPDETADHQPAQRQSTPITPPVEDSIPSGGSDSDATRFGRYRVEKLLGKGGFGEVYLAVDEELRRQVAVKVASKVIDDAGADAYLSEARIVATLDHPHIVPVYDVGRAAAGQVYVVSKFIEGNDLAATLQQERPLPRRSAELIATLADALHYAHTKGLVHRDIKPGNILADQQGQVYLCDFGLALREEQYGQGPTLAGTPAYMSPEQARGEGHRVDGRSDIYSLGVVLYEMLTGQRPFSGGVTELLRQVAQDEPKPPRQIEDSLAPELERIAFKCLAKRASDRYTTARDLAEDLRAFLAGKAETQQQEVKIVPKGLRSFDTQDSDFFLELLPGPRDRNGLPDSINFWKRRLEERDPDQTFGVGLLYGPSGCGKSSLVKAGLLPSLAENVRPVYIEATADETETRLLAGLRKACPELPNDISLKDAVAQLRLGESTRASRKVVLIIDQFEQWLHARNEYGDTELADTLRQCDGGNVQAVVMVRDDFWLAVSRLFLDLDIKLLEDHNSRLVDLFDLLHARKVLAEFGSAYGRLPDNLGQMNGEQERFLDDSVTGLATDGKVISVRLALFSEMVKGKLWTPETLKQLGGISGVGVTFLEETFSAPSAPPAHRHQQQAARAVLKDLLPGEGTDIKGHWRSQQQLLETSGYANRERDFQDLLRILDTELRLITPTNPEGEARDEEAPEAETRGRYYQLTHDYLVPALRTWLTQKQRETRRGRAELKLAERAALWNAKPENRHLPALQEWASIRTLTEKKKWTAPQRKMMSRAAAVHGLRSLLSVVTLMLLGFIGYGAYGWLQGRAAVDTLLNADPQSVLAAADRAAAFRFWTENDLRRVIAHDAATRGERRLRRHARLALLPSDPTQIEPLLEDLLITTDTAYVGVIRDALLEAKAPIETECWSRLRSTNDSASERFRAGVVLAGLAPKSDQWTEPDFQLLADQLAAMNSVYQPQFWPLLQDVGDRLLRPLETLFNDRERPESEQLASANAITFFAERDAERLAKLLPAASGPQYHILYDKYRDVAEEVTRARFEASIQRQPTDELDAASRITLGKERATAAITLLRQGERASIFDVLRYETDPESLTQFVHHCRARGVTPAELIELLDIADQRRGPLDGNRQKVDDSVMYALLLALGEFAWEDFSSGRDALVEKLGAIYEQDPSSSVHSATGWVLQRWGQREVVDRVDQTPLPHDTTGHREWFVREIEYMASGIDGLPADATTKFYLTFIVFEPGEFTMGSPDNEPKHESQEAQHQVMLTRPIAVCDRELTWAQWMAMEAARARRDSFTRQFSQTIGDNDPVFGVNWFEAVKYCRWLTERIGLEEAEQCYAAPSSIPQNGDGSPTHLPLRLEGAGFRLPTEAEWEYICRSGTATAYSFGHDQELLDRYGWYLKNSREWSHSPGQLRPNPRGLFDIHGNLSEWCQDLYAIELADATDPMGAETDHPLRTPVARGGCWDFPAGNCRSSHRSGYDVSIRYAGLGIRLVATLSKGPQAQEP